MPTVDIYALDDSATLDFGAFDVTVEDYRRAYPQLFPKGHAWDFEYDNTETAMGALIAGLAAEPSRVEQRAADLISEMDVRTAEELLPEWEEFLGLPPPGFENPPTTLERQQQAHAKLIGKNSSNEPFLLSVAAALGYPLAEIQRMGDPFTCISDCIDSLYGFEGGWLDTFTLIANDAESVNGPLLEYYINLYKQAQEIALFEYT